MQADDKNQDLRAKQITTNSNLLTHLELIEEKPQN